MACLPRADFKELLMAFRMAGIMLRTTMPYTMTEEVVLLPALPEPIRATVTGGKRMSSYERTLRRHSDRLRHRGVRMVVVMVRLVATPVI